MTDVFVSYSNEDEARALLVAEALERAGVSVWWDRKIPPGKTWDQVVGRVLQTARCIVVLWSEASVDSNWVKEEADIARRRAVLVPARIDDVDIPLGFARIEAADLVGWEGDDTHQEFQQLLESIFILVGAKAAEPLPAVPTPLIQKNAFRGVGLRWIATALVVIITAIAGFVLWPPRPSIRVWRVGSPHHGDKPDTTTPLGLRAEAEALGYEIVVEGFTASGFAQVFFDAYSEGKAPDILAIDNYGIIDGITTELGNFTGIGTNDPVRQSLIDVSGTLDELKGSRGGWQYLITTSKSHEAAKTLALRTPECRWESTSPLQGGLGQIVESIVEAYLRGATAVQQRYQDEERLLAEVPAERHVKVWSIADCGRWGNDSLAFVPVPVSVESSKSLGETTVLLILRMHDGRWQLLTATQDPVTVGEFLSGVPRLESALTVGDTGASPPPKRPRLLEPVDGAMPSPPPGVRFGNFVWQPSTSEHVVAEIVEFAYRDESRLFLRHRGANTLSTDFVSEGHLWTTGSPWSWRVWAVAMDGSLAFSEVRSFSH